MDLRNDRLNERKKKERAMGKAVSVAVSPGLYRHYKGGRYTVIGSAVDSTNCWPGQAPGEATHESVVIYIAHEHPERLCIRRAAEWREAIEWPDGNLRPRFSPDHWFTDAAPAFESDEGKERRRAAAAGLINAAKFAGNAGWAEEAADAFWKAAKEWAEALAGKPIELPNAQVPRVVLRCPDCGNELRAVQLEHDDLWSCASNANTVWRRLPNGTLQRASSGMCSPAEF